MVGSIVTIYPREDKTDGRFGDNFQTQKTLKVEYGDQLLSVSKGVKTRINRLKFRREIGYQKKNPNYEGDQTQEQITYRGHGTAVIDVFKCRLNKLLHRMFSQG